MDGERNVNEIGTDAGPLVGPARRLGFAPGQIVVEYGDDDDVEEEGHERLHSVSLHSGAAGAGRTISEIGLQPLGVEVTAVRRRGIRGAEPSGDIVLQVGDVLVLRGLPVALDLAEERLLQK